MNKKTVSVLVTGASGLVGGRLVPFLTDRGFMVRAMSRSPLEFNDVVLGDLAVPESLEEAMRGVGVVIHCAAEMGGPEFHAVNVQGTRSLVECAVASGVHRFVYVSSVAVYGEGDLLDVTEDRAVHPVTAYARSKVEAESLIKKCSELDWVILRPCTIYGSGEKRLLPGFVHMLRQGQAPIVGEGETLFDMVHVDDVCQALFKAGTLDAAKGRTYHVAEGVKRSVRSIYKIMADALGVELKTVPAIDDGLIKTLGEHRHFLIERARDELGYAPSVPLKGGLESVLKGFV